MEILCNIINVFIDTFDQLNGFILNKSINLFKKNILWQSFEYLCKLLSFSYSFSHMLLFLKIGENS